MRVIIKRAYDNIYESINPLRVLWLESDIHGATVMVLATGVNPPTWEKIAVTGSVEDVQHQVQHAIRKIKEAGLYPTKELSREMCTK